MKKRLISMLLAGAFAVSLATCRNSDRTLSDNTWDEQTRSEPPASTPEQTRSEQTQSEQTLSEPPASTPERTRSERTQSEQTQPEPPASTPERTRSEQTQPEPLALLSRNIVRIYCADYAMQFTMSECKIDFETGEFWKYFGDTWSEDDFQIQTRDASAENEGYTFVCALSDEMIEKFFKQSDKYGFTSWGENYDDILIADGHRWRITLTFADGSEKTTRGSNDYPDSWNDMGKAFRELTGDDVLLAVERR